MGKFTKAAYAVLSTAGRPLSAREIVEIAIRDGQLESSGKTPWQTMKSKLSTEILSRGSESAFMRAEKGRFALREWKGPLKEHVAERFQKALFDEDIVVFPRKSLERYIPSAGLFTGDLDRDRLLWECRPMRRRQAEEDLAVIQLVSVFVVRFKEMYLTYKRTKRLPESRLHGYYSLGFGGHLNPDDLRPLLNIFNPEVAAPLILRELGEELRLSRGEMPGLSYVGLLYDDSQPVSRQHLGITYNVYLKSDKFEIGERGFLMDAKFERLDEIVARKREFENWSWILIDKEQKCTWARNNSGQTSSRM